MSYCYHPNHNLDTTLALIDVILNSSHDSPKQFYDSLIGYKGKVEFVRLMQVSDVGKLVTGTSYLTKKKKKNTTWSLKRANQLY